MDNKKSLIALALIVLIGLVGGTFAYFTSSAKLTNEFTTGTYSTSVKEEFVSPDNWTPGTTTTKKVNVTNNGSVEVAVRAKYTEKWVAADGTTELSTIRNDEPVAQFTISSDWIKGTDNYYYYKRTLNNGETSSDFISSVTFNPNFILEEGIDIQCTTNTVDGKITTNCVNLPTGYSGATYTLEITIETIQADQAWNFERDWGTAEEFTALFTDIPEDGVVTLTKDYNLTGTQWSSIKIPSSLKSVVIDGQGHTIKGLTTEGQNGGLFSSVTNKGVTVKNLLFEDVTITGDATDTSAGGTIVGWHEGSSQLLIENVHITNINSNNFKYAGGFVGYTSSSNIEITNCTIDGGIIDGVNHVGGVVGYFSSNSTTTGNTTINNSIVKNLTIKSTNSTKGREGAIVGSLQANSYIDSVTVKNVTVMGTLATIDKVVGAVNNGTVSNITIEE